MGQPLIAARFYAPEPRCDWGTSCDRPATESAWGYGEARPFCSIHGALSREVTVVARIHREFDRIVAEDGG